MLRELGLSKAFPFFKMIPPLPALIVMVYAVMADPLVLAATQVMVAPVFETTEVVGAAGLLFLASAIIQISN